MTEQRKSASVSERRQRCKYGHSKQRSGSAPRFRSRPLRDSVRSVDSLSTHHGSNAHAEFEADSRHCCHCDCRHCRGKARAGGEGLPLSDATQE